MPIRDQARATQPILTPPSLGRKIGPQFLPTSDTATSPPDPPSPLGGGALPQAALFDLRLLEVERQVIPLPNMIYIKTTLFSAAVNLLYGVATDKHGTF
jgi:hypothetical protein